MEVESIVLNRVSSVMKVRNEYDIQMISADYVDILKRKYKFAGSKDDGKRKTIRKALMKSCIFSVAPGTRNFY